MREVIFGSGSWLFHFCLYLSVNFDLFIYRHVLFIWNYFIYIVLIVKFFSLLKSEMGMPRNIWSFCLVAFLYALNRFPMELMQKCNGCLSVQF